MAQFYYLENGFQDKHHHKEKIMRNWALYKLLHFFLPGWWLINEDDKTLDDNIPQSNNKWLTIGTFFVPHCMNQSTSMKKLIFCSFSRQCAVTTEERREANQIRQFGCHVYEKSQRPR